MKKSIITAAILAASVGGFAGNASAAFSLGFTEDSGFVFDPVYSLTATPQSQEIGIHNPLTGGRVESLWWGDNMAEGARGTVGPTTPIITTLNPGGYPATFDPAPWTTNVVGTGSDGLPNSAIKVIGLSGTLIAGGGAVPISQTFHSNQTIQSDSNGLLTSGIIRSNLTLTGYPTDVNDIAFNFFETPNTGETAPAYFCPDGSGVSCDLFQFAFSGFDPVILPGDDGNWYEISFSLLQGVNSFLLPTGWGDGACKAGNFCVGTKEGVVSYLTVLMEMNEVPEPGSLALMGLGLLGLSASLRRRKNHS